MKHLSAAGTASQEVDPGRGVWWGELDLDMDATARWRIGPLTVWLRRRPGEWGLAYERTEERDDSTVEVDCPFVPCAAPDAHGPRLDEPEDPSSRAAAAHSPADSLAHGSEVSPWDLPGPLPESIRLARIFADPAGTVEPSQRFRFRVVPVLADRPVVTRPEGFCRVMPHSEVSLFVSTPLWFRIAFDTGSSEQELFEQAIIRPSDTWFGDTTRSGELCYGSRTPAALTDAALPNLASRAITRVRIRNRASDPLDLLRLALPAPNLGLWLDQDRPELGPSTSSVEVERTSDGLLARVEVDRRAPVHLERPLEISGPRSHLSRSVLSRAMSAILS